MLYKENKENQQNKKTPQPFEVFNSGVDNKLNTILNRNLNTRLHSNKSFITQYNKTSKAFTLIELLVVIAIIGVLSTLVVVALGNSRASARDTKRITDLKAMANALELYYANNNEYPSSLTPGEPLEANGIVYMDQVPTNPTPHTDGGCPDSDYQYIAIEHKPGHYQFAGCLGNNTDPFTAGPIAYHTDSGLTNCLATVTDIEGNVYSTVQIGSQCWMKENLAYLPAVSPSNVGNMSDLYYYVNGYEGTDIQAAKAHTSYVTHGVLYNWPAAMAACPVGWKIPSREEVNILERHILSVINSQVAQHPCTDSPSEAGWSRCADSVKPPGETPAGEPGGLKGVGKSLKKVGWGLGDIGAGDDLVGFSAVLSGFRDYISGPFIQLNVGTHFWTSTESASTSVWRWYIHRDRSTVNNDTHNKAHGYSARCLKDS